MYEDRYDAILKRRFWIRALFIGIIILTMPAYCAGFWLWGTAPASSRPPTQNPDVTRTPLGGGVLTPTSTLLPTLQTNPTQTVSGPLQPTPFQFNPPPVTFPTWTPSFFIPTSTTAPTLTPFIPTITPFLPTATPFLPTLTPLPPTSTPVPPTETPMLPTNTPFPPTETPAPLPFESLTPTP